MTRFSRDFSHVLTASGPLKDLCKASSTIRIDSVEDILGWIFGRKHDELSPRKKWIFSPWRREFLTARHGIIRNLSLSVSLLTLPRPFQVLKKTATKNQNRFYKFILQLKDYAEFSLTMAWLCYAGRYSRSWKVDSDIEGLYEDFCDEIADALLPEQAIRRQEEKMCCCSTTPTFCGTQREGRRPKGLSTYCSCLLDKTQIKAKKRCGIIWTIIRSGLTVTWMEKYPV